MSYKTILALVGCLLADLMIGTFFPGKPPLFLAFGIFFLSQKMEYLEILLLAILAGFIFDISQMSHTIFSTVFLSLEASSIRYLSKRYIDFTNRFSEVLFLFVILIFKDILIWFIYDRIWPSHFLPSSLLFSLISLLLVSIVLFFKNVKTT